MKAEGFKFWSSIIIMKMKRPMYTPDKGDLIDSMINQYCSCNQAFRTVMYKFSAWGTKFFSDFNEFNAEHSE